MYRCMGVGENRFSFQFSSLGEKGSTFLLYSSFSFLGKIKAWYGYSSTSDSLQLTPSTIRSLLAFQASSPAAVLLFVCRTFPFARNSYKEKKKIYIFYILSIYTNVSRSIFIYLNIYTHINTCINLSICSEKEKASTGASNRHEEEKKEG